MPPMATLYFIDKLHQLLYSQSDHLDDHVDDRNSRRSYAQQWPQAIGEAVIMVRIEVKSEEISAR
jgi:hypothetical protein